MQAKVSIIMGSTSDWSVMEKAAQHLDQYQILRLVGNGKGCATFRSIPNSI